MAFAEILDVATRERDHMVNVTSKVEQIIAASGIDEGFCYVFNPHTTAALTVNEQADPDVARDMLASLDDAIPWKNNYRHNEGNSAAHIKASLFGTSLMLMVQNGRLVLGTWQGIFFCEFDGPRQRRLHVKVGADA